MQNDVRSNKDEGSFITSHYTFTHLEGEIQWKCGQKLYITSSFCRQCQDSTHVYWGSRGVADL